MVGIEMKLWGILIAVFTALAGGGIFLNREPIKLSIKERRATKHLYDARTAAASGDQSKAYQLALSAHLLQPSNLEALKLLLTSDHPESKRKALKLAKLVGLHPEATVNEQALALDTFLENRAFRDFWQHYLELGSEDKSHPEIRLRYARYLYSRGAGDLALQMLNKGPTSDESYRFLSASILARSESRTKRRAGQVELAEMISEGGGFANPAFRSLRAIPLQFLEAELLLPAVNQWFDSSMPNQITVVDRLTRATLKWKQIDPQNKPKVEAFVEKVIYDFGVDHPVATGNWLLAVGSIEKAIDLVKEAQIENGGSESYREALFRLQSKCLSAGEKWKELLVLLENPQVGFEPMNLAILMAIAAKRAGDSVGEVKNWQEAWRQADLNAPIRNSYLDLYHGARNANKTAIAADALIKASCHSTGNLPPNEQLTEMMLYLLENNREDDLAILTDALMQREAFSPALINNIIYIRELSNTPVAEAEMVMEGLCEKFPLSTGFRCTQIFVYLNREKKIEAMAVANELLDRVNIESLQPAEAVAVSMAFRLSGAKQERAVINLEEKLGSILAVEKRLIDKWIAN